MTKRNANPKPTAKSILREERQERDIIDRLKKKGIGAILTEAMVQQSIVDALEAYGAIVLQTNLAKGRVIADKGVPDLIITHDGWPENAWLGMEIKKPGGKATPEQAALAARKRIVIVDNVDDAIKEFRAFVIE